MKQVFRELVALAENAKDERLLPTYNGRDGSLVVTVVLEPGAGVLLSFGLGVLAWLRGCLKNAE